MNNKMITIPYADAIEYGENTSALFKALWEMTDLIRLESDLKKHHRAYLHVREEIDEKVKEARQIMTKVSVDMIGFYFKVDVPKCSSHAVVGRMVFYSIEHDKALDDLTMDEFKEFSDIIEDDIYNAISMETCVNDRKVIGGPAKEVVEKAIADAKEFLAQQ